MHGIYQKSLLKKIFWQGSHLLVVVFVFWLLFPGGLQHLSFLFGVSFVPGDLVRRILIFCTSLTIFIRWAITGFYIMKRAMGWAEAIVVSTELFIFHTSYAIVGGQVAGPVGFIECIGIILFIVGSYLNTGSEIKRLIWKKNPENKGKIYDQGLFKYSMHINYFGDSVWTTGMALISGSLWIFLIPLYMTLMFIFLWIPLLDKYLKEKYGDQFEEYSRKTKKFIPFLY